MSSIEILIFQKKIIQDEYLAELILDPLYAKKLYSALCNTIICIEDKKIIGQFTPRQSAELVSNIRNVRIHMGHIEENYKDYVMSGYEGCVYPEVADQLERLGYSISYLEE